MKKFLALNLRFVFIMLMHVKRPTIVGILTYMSRINFVLSRVEYEKPFKTSGPVFDLLPMLKKVILLFTCKG